MKRVLYLSFIVLIALSGCKKKTVKGCMDSKSTNYNSKATEDDGSCKYASDPAPTMNYIKFTLNGPGISNKTYLFSKAKNYIQTYEYSETTSGVINAALDMYDKNNGDTLIQVHFNNNTTGNRLFSTSAVFLKMVNIITGFQSSTTTGSFQIKSFAGTQLVPNGSSGTLKGKFSIDASFSGTLEEDNTGDTWTITGGDIKFDGL